MEYANSHLLDIAEDDGVEAEPGAYIPRETEDGTLEYWLNGLTVKTGEAVAHVEGLARDHDTRLGWVDAGGETFHCTVARGYLHDLEEAGYDGQGFDTKGELHDYVSDTARYGGLGADVITFVEERVLNGERLDDTVQAYLDQHGYTAFAVTGEPEHAVEQMVALAETPYGERRRLHDATHTVDISAGESVAELLE